MGLLFSGLKGTSHSFWHSAQTVLKCIFSVFLWHFLNIGYLDRRGHPVFAYFIISGFALSQRSMWKKFLARFSSLSGSGS